MKREWWHDKVAYQIYPKSFCDSNGDGIGDLPGIIGRLDYLKDLGVDIVWLSPIYRSPLADQGYDISDYYDIDPRFGTMEDVDRLLAEAKKRDMHIVMDLVVNHCSDEHDWFKKACEDPEGPYGQYFYLRKLKKAEDISADGALTAAGSRPTGPRTPAGETADPFADTSPAAAGTAAAAADTDSDGSEYAVTSPDGYVLPCNWRSYFGGPVWEKLPGHEDWFYLHVFHKKQPDLNWENPFVREEIYKMINWWLDRGLAGFRIDAIINIKKELPFRSYAPDRADGLSSIHHMLSRAQGVGDFLGEMRDRTFKPHQAFTVGEVFNEKEGELPAFIGENGYFSTMFDFSEAVWGSSPAGWHANRGITPDAYRDCLFFTQKKAGDIGFISNIIENHDEPRGVTRYIPAQDRARMDSAMYLAAKKALATIYFFAKGLPWIYQGQEIGMENLPLDSIDKVDDISSIDAWQVMRELGVSEEDALRAIERNGRDNARTPFQWTAATGAGFTTGTPWLRINPNYTAINLEAQRADPASVYSHYKKMISLRKDPVYKETFVYGSFEPYLAHEHNVIAYLRRTGPASAGTQTAAQATAGTGPASAGTQTAAQAAAGTGPDSAGTQTAAQAAAGTGPASAGTQATSGTGPASAGTQTAAQAAAGTGPASAGTQATSGTGPDSAGTQTAAEAIPASAGARTILVLSNYQLEPRVLPLPVPVKKVLLNNLPDSSAPVSSAASGGSISLAGYQTLVLELETDPAASVLPS